MSEHSPRYSPSSFARRMACPASARIEEYLPDTTSKYSEEGTAAHELAAKCLVFAHDAHDYLGHSFNGVTVDEEMAEYVQQYVDYVRNAAGKHLLMAERRVDFSHLAPNGFGTADAIIVDTDNRHLIVVDLKYGKGVRVDATHNIQAQLYALGALHSYEAIIGDQIDTVTVVVHQPRLDHVSEWSQPLEALLIFAQLVVKTAEACERDDAPFGPGEAQCQFCKAKATCAARANAVVSTVSGDAIDFTDFTTGSIWPKEALDNSDIAALLPHLDEVIHWVRDLKAYAAAEIENGREIPGYKLVEGRSVRKWGDEAAVAAKLKGMRLRQAEIYERKIISVAKAQKVLGKRFAKLDDLIAKPPGKPTLAPVDDKRPAINFSFENLNQE